MAGWGSNLSAKRVRPRETGSDRRLMSQGGGSAVTKTLNQLNFVGMQAQSLAWDAQTTAHSAARDLRLLRAHTEVDTACALLPTPTSLVL